MAVDETTAEFYAQVFFELRQKGRPIPSNDLWLAASALQHGLALATYDDHFSAISGLLLAIKKPLTGVAPTHFTKTNQPKRRETLNYRVSRRFYFQFIL